ncbi:hypothetical protein BESB_019280 [Besnoitia besnoiti]|uniref:Uncharacterized protein n=1 Tax=Besnoitia besnoiti TaxID=94643 RepID=A0A2A9M8M7_BESBE|nr:hypothetical protein BESB_019280 [Besnoitia besnoiti]PFH31987.1 hypothetical protein BESB_019280 [Besnoitia besnoiti]
MTSTEVEALNAALLRARQNKHDIADFLTELENEKFSWGTGWAGLEAGRAYAADGLAATRSPSATPASPLLHEIERARETVSSASLGAAIAKHVRATTPRGDGGAEKGSTREPAASSPLPAAPVQRTPLREIDSFAVGPPRMEVIVRSYHLGGELKTNTDARGTSGLSTRCLRHTRAPLPPPVFRALQSRYASNLPTPSHPRSPPSPSPSEARASSPSPLLREDSVFALTSVKDPPSSASSASAAALPSSSSGAALRERSPSPQAALAISPLGLCEGETVILPAFVRKYFETTPDGKPLPLDYQIDTVGEETSSKKQNTKADAEDDLYELHRGPLAQLHWSTEDEGCLFSSVMRQAEGGVSNEADGIVACDRLAAEESAAPTVLQLLAADREAILRQRNLIPDDEFSRQLKAAEDLLSGWRTVERLDLALEQKESQLRNLKAEIARTRDRMRRFFYTQVAALPGGLPKAGAALALVPALFSFPTLTSKSGSTLESNSDDGEQDAVSPLNLSASLDLMLQSQAVCPRAAPPSAFASFSLLAALDPHSPTAPSHASNPSASAAGAFCEAASRIVSVWRRAEGEARKQTHELLPRHLRERRRARSEAHRCTEHTDGGGRRAYEAGASKMIARATQRRARPRSSRAAQATASSGASGARTSRPPEKTAQEAGAQPEEALEGHSPRLPLEDRRDGEAESLAACSVLARATLGDASRQIIGFECAVSDERERQERRATRKRAEGRKTERLERSGEKARTDRMRPERRDGAHKSAAPTDTQQASSRAPKAEKPLRSTRKELRTEGARMRHVEGGAETSGADDEGPGELSEAAPAAPRSLGLQEGDGTKTRSSGPPPAPAAAPAGDPLAVGTCAASPFAPLAVAGGGEASDPRLRRQGNGDAAAPRPEGRQETGKDDEEEDGDAADSEVATSFVSPYRPSSAQQTRLSEIAARLSDLTSSSSLLSSLRPSLTASLGSHASVLSRTSSCRSSLAPASHLPLEDRGDAGRRTAADGRGEPDAGGEEEPEGGGCAHRRRASEAAERASVFSASAPFAEGSRHDKQAAREELAHAGGEAAEAEAAKGYGDAPSRSTQGAEGEKEESGDGGGEPVPRRHGEASGRSRESAAKSGDEDFEGDLPGDDGAHELELRRAVAALASLESRLSLLRQRPACRRPSRAAIEQLLAEAAKEQGDLRSEKLSACASFASCERSARSPSLSQSSSFALRAPADKRGDRREHARADRVLGEMEQTSREPGDEDACSGDGGAERGWGPAEADARPSEPGAEADEEAGEGEGVDDGEVNGDTPSRPSCRRSSSLLRFIQEQQSHAERLLSEAEEALKARRDEELQRRQASLVLAQDAEAIFMEMQEHTYESGDAPGAPHGDQQKKEQGRRGTRLTYGGTNSTEMARRLRALTDAQGSRQPSHAPSEPAETPSVSHATLPVASERRDSDVAPRGGLEDGRAQEKDRKTDEAGAVPESANAVEAEKGREIGAAVEVTDERSPNAEGLVSHMDCLQQEIGLILGQLERREEELQRDEATVERAEDDSASLPPPPPPALTQARVELMKPVHRAEETEGDAYAGDRPAGGQKVTQPRY